MGEVIGVKDVIGISLGNNNKIYYFSPNNIKLKKGITVIVETERGLQFGKVETDIIKVDSKKFSNKIKNVIRISTKKDYYKHKENLSLAEEALKNCRRLVLENKLNMKILDASFTFDRSQLLFHFLSDNRVDFRNLAKDLASIYKTRIELRQLGVRDKAKNIGGIGCCGRELCCHSFLSDLESVSINMAKNQNLSLNPTKINGVCGRILCCLKYEDSNYKECRKTLPNIGDTVNINGKFGQVVNIDILNKKYSVDIPNIGIIEVQNESNS